MGMIICEIHGESGVVFVCPHIEKLLNEQERVNDFTVIKVDVGDVGAITKHVFCNTCVSQYKLASTDEVFPDSAVDSYEEAFSITQPYCGRCVSKLIG